MKEEAARTYQAALWSGLSRKKHSNNNNHRTTLIAPIECRFQEQEKSVAGLDS
jgi:hypothetical protein